MTRALFVLTGGAVLTLALGVVGSSDPVWALVLGVVFAVLATAGFVWVQSPRRRHPLAVAMVFVALQLLLGLAIFAVSDAAVGSTLLLVVLVCQSVILLPLPVAVVVIALVPLAHVGMSWSDGLREGLGTLAAMAFAAVVTVLLQREQRAHVELAEANGQLRGYAVQAERLATAQERNRVARDIHDGLGHSLTVVQMQVKAARAVLASDAARADAVLAKAQEQSERALAEVRRSVANLREVRSSPPLPEALRDLTEQASAAGVATRLDLVGPVRPLSADAEESLYRAAQEGLTNVRKHAQATNAGVVLDFSRPTAVHLEVHDDGPGVADVGAAIGFGLLGLRERATHIGGQLSFESHPGQGSTLRMELPG